MPLESHINSLEKRHQKLEGILEQMQISPSVNNCDVSNIKRQKLQLKDRIEQLKSETSLN